MTEGRTVRSVNLLTGFEATLHYGADGKISRRARPACRA
jgi:hypothetical protein